MTQVCAVCVCVCVCVFFFHSLVVLRWRQKMYAQKSPLCSLWARRDVNTAFSEKSSPRRDRISFHSQWKEKIHSVISAKEQPSVFTVVAPHTSSSTCWMAVASISSLKSKQLLVFSLAMTCWCVQISFQWTFCTFCTFEVTPVNLRVTTWKVAPQYSEDFQTNLLLVGKVCVCSVCEWVKEQKTERKRERGRERERERERVGWGGMDLMPVHTPVWHYESWRLLCLTSDVFWSSQWASGERLAESSAEQHTRGAAEMLNGSEMRNDSGVNAFIKIAVNRQGRTGEANEGCACSAAVGDAEVTSAAGAETRHDRVCARCAYCCFTRMFDLHCAEWCWQSLTPEGCF